MALVVAEWIVAHCHAKLEIKVEAHLKFRGILDCLSDSSRGAVLLDIMGRQAKIFVMREAICAAS